MKAYTGYMQPFGMTFEEVEARMVSALGMQPGSGLAALAPLYKPSNTLGMPVKYTKRSAGTATKYTFHIEQFDPFERSMRKLRGVPDDHVRAARDEREAVLWELSRQGVADLFDVTFKRSYNDGSPRCEVHLRRKRKRGREGFVNTRAVKRVVEAQLERRVAVVVRVS